MQISDTTLFGSPVYVFNTICYHARAMHGQVGRSLLRHFIELRERKVRTLKGSEPANGGAFEDLRFQISDLRFQIFDRVLDLKSGILRRRQVQQRTDQPFENSDSEISEGDG